jgi:hypothetical protein
MITLYTLELHINVGRFFYLYEPSVLFLKQIRMVPVPHVSFKFHFQKKVFAFNFKNQI